MVRYIAWAIPSIGFIGTVRGIGDALGQAHQAVEGDIAGVTQSLGTAFNSTFIALLISIVLMFLLHQLQLQQERLVLDTETYVDEHLIQHLQVSCLRARTRDHRGPRDQRRRPPHGGGLPTEPAAGGGQPRLRPDRRRDAAHRRRRGQPGPAQASPRAQPVLERAGHEPAWPARSPRDLTVADLAHAHLSQVWELCGGGVDELLLVVPGTSPTPSWG